jgi:uncharacterized protein YaaR (DUF327 family)
MRIKDSSPPRDLTTNTRGTSTQSSGTSIFGLFSAQISQKEQEIDNYEQDVADLRKEIETAGDKLVQEPTLSSFKHFREVLSRLAKRINNEAYRLEKFGGTPQNPRYYETITIINREADRLYNLIVQEQKDNMAIIAKVIGIKGLVVDLIT